MAKGKIKFKIETPRGTVYTQSSKGGKVTARLEWNAGFAPDKERGFANAQEFVDSECIRRMNPETPRRTGMLIKSATLGTVIGSGEINQIAPYARRQYYEHKEKSRWFERMKNRHKDSILKGAAKYV
nr:MAG TPA: Minor capsid protein [Caudoviricetes sp.]